MANIKFGEDMAIPGFPSTGNIMLPKFPDIKTMDSGVWLPKSVSNDFYLKPPTFSDQDLFT